jgi:hypothetical protein
MLYFPYSFLNKNLGTKIYILKYASTKKKIQRKSLK